jgi:hypothetical protein
VLTLLWGLATDTCIARVHHELNRLGAPVWLLDQAEVLDTEAGLDVAGEPTAWLQAGGRRLDLAEVTAAYPRPYDSRSVPPIAAAGVGSDDWRHAESIDETISCWLELTDTLVVNRLSAMSGNGSKPWQLARVAQAGFAVPETLVTTDPAAARSFWMHHGEVIYKSVSGVRSRVARLGPADAARLADVASCPTQLQRYIEGTDVRVHVVGRQVFPTVVRCNADDYRYAAEQGCAPPELAPAELPPEIEARCRRLAATLGLVVAGIDLRVTPEGTWYCFEANPSPAFNYYEYHTGQPIARAIACLLASAGVFHKRGRSGRANPCPCSGAARSRRRSIAMSGAGSS